MSEVPVSASDEPAATFGAVDGFALVDAVLPLSLECDVRLVVSTLVGRSSSLLVLFEVVSAVAFASGQQGWACG